MAHIHMHPQELIDLRQELAHTAHADVRLKFQVDNTHTDMASQLGVLAGILNIAVEGYFDEEGVLERAKAVHKKLIEKRQADAVWHIEPGKIIVPNTGGLS